MAARFPDDTPDTPEEDILTCSICKEPFTDPKVLPCTHTFCAGCLHQYYDSHTDDDAAAESKRPTTLPCPVCRVHFTVPDLGIGDLHKNSKPGPLAEIARIQVKPQKAVYCDVCKYSKHDVIAKDHCTHCGISYCGVCSRDHECHKLFQNHAVVPIKEMDKTKALKCEVHEAEAVRYYCVTCMSPLCTVCAVAEHKGHVTMELAAAMGNKKETVNGKIGTMSEKVVRHEQTLIELEDVISVREAAMKKTKLEIERHTASLAAQLERRKQQLIEDVERTHDAGLKQINLEKENCAFQLANMKSLWKFAAKLTEPSQALQLIAMHGDLMKMVDSMVVAPDPSVPRELLTMDMFVPRENLVLGELQKCELSTDTIRRISEGTSNGFGSRAASPPLSMVGAVSHDELTLKWHTPKQLWKIDKTGNRPGEINEAYDVAILAGGNVVIAEWLSQRLQLFDSTGYSRDVVGQGQIQPWGVAVTPDGNLATTDEKDRTVKVYSPNGYLVTSWKKNMFGWPRGIVVNHSGQFIVTDNQHGRHSVSLHLPDGQCIRQFGSQGSGNEQFHWPRYVTVDGRDRIIVADSSNHCVKVFDSTGRFQLKFGSLGSGDGQMKHPRGVCVDPNGDIVVADQDNNRISLYSRDGKFIRHVLNIHRPWGVALTENGYMAVTQKPALCYYKVFDPMP